MTRYTAIDYSAILPEKMEMQGKAEFSSHVPVDLGWGRLNTTAMSLPDIAVFKFDSTTSRNVQLVKRMEMESTTVDTCIFLRGNLESKFEGLDTTMMMEAGMQNFIYQPEPIADYYIPSQENISILHLMIDKRYYTKLLSDDEKWSADLKEDILNKKLVCGLRHNTQVSPRMNGIVNDILNCNLTGSLRSIVIEARILEFLALQLDLLAKEKDAVIRDDFKRGDKDRLFALRDHVRQTYNHDHSLRALGRQFAINEFKLKKGFKSLFGTTVFEYIHDLKMDHASNLLLSGEMYVNEVAAMVGYRNANHFSTAFKRKFGVNPMKYK